ncbi:MAG: Nif3-like dinuclear metal center hexameric protein [Planctomycetota bacterium]
MIDRGRLLSVLSELAPLELAEDWDNVGVLVDPTPREIRRILLCIDFSEAVLDEALSAGVDWVVAYHPLIFSGLKRLSHTPAPSVS